MIVCIKCHVLHRVGKLIETYGSCVDDLIIFVSVP